ncbi:hypothetical protein JL722_8371 [Aureococcus anophagefferens]|nr:hypothetical protein JL722_8371 [Aureococcus anophagefferens]
MADVVAVGVAPAAAPDASAPASAAAPKKKGFTLRLRGRTKSGSPAKRSSPKKAGFLSRTFRFGGGKGGVGATMRDLGASVRGGLQAAVEVLKESDQVVVVQAWDGTEHGVDVLKPCKVRAAKVVHMVKRADGVDDAAADQSAAPARVLLFRGATLEDGDAVPDAAFKPDDFEFVSQAKARRRVSNLAGQQAVRRKSSVAAREHPQSEKFHLRRELAAPLRRRRGPFGSRGYDDRGAFGNLTEEILRATPLFVNRRTSRKIVALAEIYKQQGARGGGGDGPGNMDKAEAEDTAAFTAGDDVFFGKRSDVRKFFGSRKAGGSVAGDASTLGSRGASGGDRRRVERRDDRQRGAVRGHGDVAELHGSSLSSLTTRKRKEKRTVNPLFAHVGRIGKGVPDLPGEDPSLQERLDALLQPVGAGLRGQQTETIRAVELVLGDVFAKDKFRDEYLEAMIEANSGNSVPSAVTAVKRRATALDGVGVSIRLKRPEDRAMAVHKLATKLYENAFSPTYPELQDFLFRLLGRDAVVERNGQAVRDRSELERAHRALSKSVVDDAATKIHSRTTSPWTTARELMSEESQAALGGHLRSDASSLHSERARRATANNDEQETVFEVLRRRDAVLPELAPLDDGLTPVSSADLVAFRDAHMDAVRRYVAFRDEWRKAELPEEESTKRSSGGRTGPSRSPKSVSIASTPAGSNQPSPNRPRERKAFDP